MLHPQLELFFLVVESGSFSRAAAARPCSPVAVMNQMNALEERLGVRLFMRSPRGVALTEAGASLYRDAKKLDEAGARALHRAQAIGTAEKPVIRLGTSFLRPCRPLLERLDAALPAWRDSFRLRLVPFTDCPADFTRLQQKVGTEIDGFVSPADSTAWQEEFALFPLGKCRCCISLAADHELAGRGTLTWTDLCGQTLMLVARGTSPTLDRLRDEIAREHPAITLLDAPGYYDMEVFNRCAQAGYLMETPEIWAGVHPSLVTLPVEWDYALHYGIVCAKEPSPGFTRFLAALREAS